MEEVVCGNVSDSAFKIGIFSSSAFFSLIKVGGNGGAAGVVVVLCDTTRGILGSVVLKWKLVGTVIMDEAD